MAKQVLRSEQMSLMVNDIVYKNCYFINGATTFSATTGARDYNVDTGVPKFPNNLLAFGVGPAWTSVTWNQNWKKGTLYQGTTNLELSIYFYAGANLSKGVDWWALGN